MYMLQCPDRAAFALYRANAALSGHCNIYLLDIPKQPTCMNPTYIAQDIV